MNKKLIFILYLLLIAISLPACSAQVPVSNQSPIQPAATETQVILPAPTQTIASLLATATPAPIATPTAPIEPATPVEVETVLPTEVPSDLPLPTATEAQATPEAVGFSCADVEANWGQNWDMVVVALEALIASQQPCGEEPLLQKKYAAHFSYAASLEGTGQVEAAIGQYHAALLINPQRSEALNALIRLDALPEPTPVPCTSPSPPLPDPAPPMAQDPSRFVTVQGNQLWLDGQPFKVKGVNYYPRRAPWHRFIEEADMAEVALELAAVQQAGFNTVRVFYGTSLCLYATLKTLFRMRLLLPKSTACFSWPASMACISL